MSKTLPQATIIKCDGEAHSNPYIDNCLRCAPNWGFTLHCASCGTQLKYSPRATLKRDCPTCGIRHAKLDYAKIYRESRNA